jgi:hypothetical protein
MERIAGRAPGAKSGQRIVLFAKSGTWWVQPMSTSPFTSIGEDLTWRNVTHMGTDYAALLVDKDYFPPKTVDVLPAKGGNVLAVATVAGRRTDSSPPPVPKRIHFSGYEWEVLEVPSDSGGVMHANSAANVWTDESGRLHLRIARRSGEWTCAEISLTRSLGYGLYSFVVASLPKLEPGTVLGLFTWDPLEAGENHREIDIELSQWGDPASKNAQFVIQPFYVPANVYRFNAPRTRTAHSFHWEPGRVTFKSALMTQGKRSPLVAEQTFTSGIPTPGAERVHINLYIYGKTRTPQQNDVEVVLERFEYLP